MKFSNLVIVSMAFTLLAIPKISVAIVLSNQQSPTYSNQADCLIGNGIWFSNDKICILPNEYNEYSKQLTCLAIGDVWKNSARGFLDGGSCITREQLSIIPTVQTSNAYQNCIQMQNTACTDGLMAAGDGTSRYDDYSNCARTIKRLCDAVSLKNYQPQLFFLGLSQSLCVNQPNANATTYEQGSLKVIPQCTEVLLPSQLATSTAVIIPVATTTIIISPSTTTSSVIISTSSTINPQPVISLVKKPVIKNVLVPKQLNVSTSSTTISSTTAQPVEVSKLLLVTSSSMPATSSRWERIKSALRDLIQSLKIW